MLRFKILWWRKFSILTVQIFWRTVYIKTRRATADFSEQIGTDCHRDDSTAIRVRTMFILFNRDDQLSLGVVIGTIYRSYGIEPWYTFERLSYWHAWSQVRVDPCVPWVYRHRIDWARMMIRSGITSDRSSKFLYLNRNTQNKQG